MEIFKRKLLLCLSLLGFVQYNLESKIRLFTFHCNRPDFLEIQYKTLKKFLVEKDDFELIVFNDATNNVLKQQIEQVCQNLNIACVNFPQELHNNPLSNPPEILKLMEQYGLDSKNGSVRHCQLVQYALNLFGYHHDDIVGLIEGDVFLVKNFSIRKAIEGYHIIGGLQRDRIEKGIEYIWIGLTFFDIKNLPNKETFNFNLTWHNRAFLDSGGNTYFYLQKNPSVRAKKYPGLQIMKLSEQKETVLQSQSFSEQEIVFLKNANPYFKNFPDRFPYAEYYMENAFIHIGRSRSSRLNDPRIQLFKDLFLELLNDNSPNFTLNSHQELQKDP